jgi:long-chain acyl-CoA synthetase
VLTHGNLIANSAGCSRVVEFLPGDVHISYLPLAHIYERVNTISCTHAGGAIGFYSGDVQRLLDDISTLRPTIFASVPRLWNRIHDKVCFFCFQPKVSAHVVCLDDNFVAFLFYKAELDLQA